MIHCDCEAKVFDPFVQGKRDWFTAANEFSYTDKSDLRDFWVRHVA